MKLVLGLIFGLSLTASARADRHCNNPAACLPMNFEVQLTGKHMGPLQEDYDNVRKAIGNLVADMKVKKFVHMAFGTEGGFVVCVESLDAQAHADVLQTLKSIKVDSNQTYYEIKRVNKCGI